MEEGLYYPCSKNKGADQLRGYREADLRLCFRMCKKSVFSRRGSFMIMLLSHIQVILELQSALNAAKYDDSNLVMLSGLDNVFCSGIDLHFLQSGDKKVAARQMVDALR